MMRDQAVVRLDKNDAESMDRWIDQGLFDTRSAFIRQAIRHFDKVLTQREAMI